MYSKQLLEAHSATQLSASARSSATTATSEGSEFMRRVNATASRMEGYVSLSKALGLDSGSAVLEDGSLGLDVRER